MSDGHLYGGRFPLLSMCRRVSSCSGELCFECCEDAAAFSTALFHKDSVAVAPPERVLFSPVALSSLGCFWWGQFKAYQHIVESLHSHSFRLCGQSCALRQDGFCRAPQLQPSTDSLSTIGRMDWSHKWASTVWPLCPVLFPWHILRLTQPAEVPVPTFSLSCGDRPCAMCGMLLPWCGMSTARLLLWLSRRQLLMLSLTMPSSPPGVSMHVQFFLVHLKDKAWPDPGLDRRAKARAPLDLGP